MRAGSDEQSAAALPFRTQAGIDERMRTGDCYCNAGSYQKECHDAERSQLSPDEIHAHSSRFDVQSVSYVRSDNHCSKPERLHDRSIREDYVVMSDRKRGADVRPDFNFSRQPVEMMGYR